MAKQIRSQVEIDLSPPAWALVLEKYKSVDPEDALLPENEAALVVEQAPKTLEGWRLRGQELPFCKLGRQIRYRLSDLLAYRRRTFTSSREAMNRERSLEGDDA